jgi:Uma2 family endonuclease
MSKSNLATAEKLYTEEEYLAFEREASDKHELIDGEIVAMAGATREHNLISGNVFANLHLNLRGRKFEAYINDMRVHMLRVVTVILM